VLRIYRVVFCVRLFRGGGFNQNYMPDYDLTAGVYKWSMLVKLKRLLWNFVWYALAYWGPRKLSWLRVILLRLFGASIGQRVLICSRVKVLMPWNLVIGNATAIAERVDIYNFDLVEIGSHVVVSQDTLLCTGTHDYRDPVFPLIWKPIKICDKSWVAARSIILPGVTLGEGTVIGAGSVVSKNIPDWSVGAGNPCVVVKQRVLK
jgi:putative colanic acid biosynthesis acetyltransferase WcaF